MKKKLFTAVCVLALCLSLSPAYAENAETGDNTAPLAENFELTTYRNVSIGGQLAAVDPDGDPVTFRLTTEPVKGVVELQENGKFVGLDHKIPLGDNGITLSEAKGLQ